MEHFFELKMYFFYRCVNIIKNFFKITKNNDKYVILLVDN